MHIASSGFLVVGEKGQLRQPPSNTRTVISHRSHSHLNHVLSI